MQDRGYTVLDAESGSQAITLARSHRQKNDLLLTDVIMPEMKGPEVFAQISKIHPENKVIYMSGYPGKTNSRHGVLQKETEMANKAFSARVLLEKIATVLGRSS